MAIGARVRLKAKKPSKHSKPHAPAKRAATLSRAELDALVEEATVDAHDEEEQATGFWSVLDDELVLPFETEVLGLRVSVETLEMTDSYDIVAVCQAGKKRQRVRLVDLPLPDPSPQGAKWIAAYRHWRRED